MALAASRMATISAWALGSWVEIGQLIFIAAVLIGLVYNLTPTPAIELAAGSLAIAAPLALKLESLQLSGSFKGRGAFHKLLATKVPAAGIVAAS